MHIVLSAANGSLHSVTEYLKNGFLPLKNGHRMGICAEGIYQNGALSGIQNVTSLCIRIAREHHGCADRVLETISFLDFRSTIIVAPPGGGKTTFLREVIRKLSQKGKYISVSDERGEISGFCNGETAFDIGPRTDVLYGIRKQEAAIMLLRTMAPDILAMDEITAYNDIHVIKEALGCGVELLATMHGKDRTVFEKPVFFEISQMKAFQYAVFIEVKDGNRFYHVEELYA